jgi:hypothetical protein
VTARYRGEIDTAFKPVQDELDKLDKEKTRISELLTAHPKLVAKGATVAHGRRTPPKPLWELDLASHLDALGTLTDLDDPAKVQNITPKFATEKGRINRMD